MYKRQPLNSADLEEDLLHTLPGGNGDDWLISINFNANHSNWDRLAREDQRGRWLMEWADERGLVILNDGSPTRTERGTNRVSSPDVTLCCGLLAERAVWKVDRALGSDHFPILAEFGSGSDFRPP